MQVFKCMYVHARICVKNNLCSNVRTIFLRTNKFAYVWKYARIYILVSVHAFSETV